MSESQQERIPSISDVLGRIQMPEELRLRVLRDLLDREDQIRVALGIAGMQFGLFPQIVAEVLAEVGLGTPRSEAERTMIRQQFTALMEQISRAQRGEGPMPSP